MNVIVLGCGRVGARVASALSQRHEVAVVDWNATAFERLSSDFVGATVVGNGIDVDVLREAGVVGADAFLALTDGDNRNIMAAQMAAQLGVRQAVARVYDAARCDIFGDMGITVISPTINGARRLFDMVVAGGEGN